MWQKIRQVWSLPMWPENDHTANALTMEITVTDDVENRLGW